MKKVMTICFLAFIAAGVLFAGCKREKQARTFGYTCFYLANPFFTILEQTIFEEVEKNGDRLITVDPDRDREKQISQIEELISQKIDALFLNPVDLEAIRPALVSLNQAKIPVINFDSEVKDLDLVAAYVGSDNRNAGYICGVDGSPAAKTEIAKRGQFAGSGAQSPISIAKESVTVAYKILNKQPYEKRIPVRTFMINQVNIDQYDIDGWQGQGLGVLFTK